MATQNSISSKSRQADDFIRLQDLFYLCLGKWHWFVVSLALAVGVAAVYLLATPPVYTRSASLLIKEGGGKGNSMNGAAGVLGDIDLFQTSTNVNNEILSLQSPSVMLEVVKRLRLDVGYHAEGRFRKEALYGRSCPYAVSFDGLRDNESVGFTITPGPDGQVVLAGFSHDGEDVGGEVAVELGDTVSTPVGRLVVEASSDSTSYADAPVHVSRTGYQAAASAYSSRLSVSLGDEKSTVIGLSIQDVCPQRAEDVLNTLIAVYNENWIKDKNQVAVSTSQFISERLGVIERELGSVDEDISSYKSEHLLPDVQAAASMYMAQSSEAGEQILALNTQLSMARYVRNYLANSSGKNQLLPANSGIESQGIEKQIAEYNTMQLRRNDLVANSSERNPLVADMDQSLQNMRAAIVTSIDNLITTLNTRLRSLQQSERQATERIAANPSQGKYLLSVERQQKVKEALYLFLLQKREENELSQAFTAYNTRVVTPPWGSMDPTAPVRRNIALVAIALGLLVPVAVIFIRENMDTKVRGRKDLEGLSLPFAGEIPRAPAPRRQGNAASAPALLVRQGERDMVNEAFRVLRTNLEFMLGAGPSSGAHTVLLTSFNPGSGKTFLAMNTAAAFALKGKKVLAVDCDLRRATLSRILAPRAKGLGDYLGGLADGVEGLVREVPGHPGLSVLPAGTLPPNPSELLAGERFKELLGRLHGSYDHVFLDCPPADMVADTRIIGKLADRTLFVVRAGLMDRDMLPELQRMYDGGRFKGMAVVLNGTEASGRRHGYGYGYGGGYYGPK